MRFPKNKYPFQLCESCRIPMIVNGIVLIYTMPFTMMEIRLFDALKCAFIFWKRCTQTTSKVGNLTRRLLRFFVCSLRLVYEQCRSSQTKNLRSRLVKFPTFEVVWVYK